MYLKRSSATTTSKSAHESSQPDALTGIRVEFSINATNQGELDKIYDALKSRGVDLVQSNLADKTIQIELRHDAKRESSDIQTLQRFIEDRTGLLTVVKGFGDFASAVAELQNTSATATSNSHTDHVVGVMRVSQLSDGHCLFDGLLDGFERRRGPQRYSVAVHEFGDLSEPANGSVGKPIAEIDRIDSTDDGRASVRQILEKCDVSSMIGRSIAVTKHGDNPKDMMVISAGVLARASVIEGNRKQICTCSGKTLWDERIDKRQDQEN